MGRRCRYPGAWRRVSEGRLATGAASPRDSMAWGARGTTDCCSPRGSTHSRFCDEGSPARRQTHKRVAPEEAGMDVVYERCCGLDIHVRLVPPKRTC